MGLLFWVFVVVDEFAVFLIDFGVLYCLFFDEAEAEASDDFIARLFHLKLMI